MICVFLALPFRGTAKRIPDRLLRIIVVQGAKMGDMICTTPVFHAIKMKYPQVQLTVVCTALNREILKGNTDIDNYIVYDHNPFRFIRAVRDEAFDYGVVVAPDPYALSALFLANVRAIAAPLVTKGFCPAQTRIYRFLLRFGLIREHQMGEYTPREYLRLLEPIGITSTDTTKRLAYTEDAARTIESFLRQNHCYKNQTLFGIAPSVGNRIKEWPPERFAELVHYIRKTYGVKVLLIGGSHDKKAAQATLQAIGTASSVIDTVGIFSLDELKAIVARLTIFISVDTGTTYIAEAFGVPTVDIIGPLHEKEQAPHSTCNRIVFPLRKEAALHILNARPVDESEARRQVLAVTVADVQKELDALVRECMVVRTNFEDSKLG